MRDSASEDDIVGGDEMTRKDFLKKLGIGVGVGVALGGTKRNDPQLPKITRHFRTEELKPPKEILSRHIIADYSYSGISNTYRVGDIVMIGTQPAGIVERRLGVDCFLVRLRTPYYTIENRIKKVDVVKLT